MHLFQCLHLQHNGGRAKLHPDSQAEPRVRGDAETKGLSGAESRA